MDPVWRVGAFAGRSWNSDQNCVLLPDGTITRALALVRVVESKRWQLQRLEICTMTPDMETTASTDAIELDPAPHRGIQPDKEHDQFGHGEIQHHIRRLELYHDDLLKYGYAPRCPKCDLYQSDPLRAHGSRHSEACRKRIYDVLRRDDSNRLTTAEDAGRVFSRGASGPSTAAVLV